MAMTDRFKYAITALKVQHIAYLTGFDWIM